MADGQAKFGLNLDACNKIFDVLLAFLLISFHAMCFLRISSLLCSVSLLWLTSTVHEKKNYYSTLYKTDSKIKFQRKKNLIIKLIFLLPLSLIYFWIALPKKKN